MSSISTNGSVNINQTGFAQENHAGYFITVNIKAY